MRFCAPLWSDQKRSGLIGGFSVSRYLFWFLAFGEMLSLPSFGEMPEATRLFPPGGMQGRTVTVKATGKFPVWPVSVWTDRSQCQWKPLAESGTFEVSIAAQEALGVHLIRLYTPGGSTAVRRFVVGNLVEFNEVEPNDKRSELTLQTEIPAVINGILSKSGDADCYLVRLEKGETLIAHVDAHHQLRSPVDSTLELIDARQSIVIRNLDASGLDPRIVYHAQHSGDFIVRVFGFPETPDSTIGLAGGDGFVYRLTLAKNSFLSGVLPLAVSRTSDTSLVAVGWNLPEAVKKILFKTPQDTTDQKGESQKSPIVISIPGIAGQAVVAIVENPVVTLSEPTQEAIHTAQILPGTFSGSLSLPGQIAVHSITAAKDSRWIVSFESQSLGYSIDPMLSLVDSDGKVLHANDEPSPTFVWQVPAEGQYKILISDRQRLFGPSQMYRLSVQPETPRVVIKTDLDRIATEVSKPTDIVLQIDRQYGFKDPLEIVFLDAPGSIQAMPVVSLPEGDTSKKVTLTFSVSEPFSGPVRLVARKQVQMPSPDSLPTLFPVVCGPEGIAPLWIASEVPSVAK